MHLHQRHYNMSTASEINIAVVHCLCLSLTCVQHIYFSSIPSARRERVNHPAPLQSQMEDPGHLLRTRTRSPSARRKRHVYCPPLAKPIATSSISGQSQPARRNGRAKSVDIRRPLPDTFTYLAETNAMLSVKLVHLTEKLDEHKEQIDLLRKQCEENDNTIQKLQEELQEKEEHLARLRHDLQHELQQRAVNRNDMTVASLHSNAGENAMDDNRADDSLNIAQPQNAGLDGDDEAVGGDDGEQFLLRMPGVGDDHYVDRAEADSSTQPDTAEFGKAVDKISTLFEIANQRDPISIENGGRVNAARADENMMTHFDEAGGNGNHQIIFVLCTTSNLQLYFFFVVLKGSVLLSNAVAIEQAQASSASQNDQSRPDVPGYGEILFDPEMGLDAVADAEARDIFPLTLNGDWGETASETQYFVVTDDGVFSMIVYDEESDTEK